MVGGLEGWILLGSFKNTSVFFNDGKQQLAPVFFFSPVVVFFVGICVRMKPCCQNTGNVM